MIFSVILTIFKKIVIWKNMCSAQIINFNTIFWKVWRQISARWIANKPLSTSATTTTITATPTCALSSPHKCISVDFDGFDGFGSFWNKQSTQVDLSGLPRFNYLGLRNFLENSLLAYANEIKSWPRHNKVSVRLSVIQPDNVTLSCIVYRQYTLSQLPTRWYWWCLRRRGRQWGWCGVLTGG